MQVSWNYGSYWNNASEDEELETILETEELSTAQFRGLNLGKSNFSTFPSYLKSYQSKSDLHSGTERMKEFVNRYTSRLPRSLRRKREKYLMERKLPRIGTSYPNGLNHLSAQGESINLSRSTGTNQTSKNKTVENSNNSKPALNSKENKNTLENKAKPTEETRNFPEDQVEFSLANAENLRTTNLNRIKKALEQLKQERACLNSRNAGSNSSFSNKTLTPSLSPIQEVEHILPALDFQIETSETARRKKIERLLEGNFESDQNSNKTSKSKSSSSNESSTSRPKTGQRFLKKSASISSLPSISNPELYKSYHYSTLKYSKDTSSKSIQEKSNDSSDSKENFLEKNSNHFIPDRVVSTPRGKSAPANDNSLMNGSGKQANYPNSGVRVEFPSKLYYKSASGLEKDSGYDGSFFLETGKKQLTVPPAHPAHKKDKSK